MDERSAASGDFLLGHRVPANEGEDACLRNGEQYRQSLRDGRRVIVDGEEVEDVTTQPGLKAGIDTFAALFDAQFDPDTRDVTTSVDPATGRRIATGWLVPRCLEDLARHDAQIRFSTHRTLGVFGRPPDYGPVKAIGFLAFRHLIERDEPEAMEKIEHFLDVGSSHNLISADVIIDVQANRKLSGAEMPGRLRVVEERPDALVVYGAKAGNTMMPQGNIGTISMPPPARDVPEECMLWAAVPANLAGLTLVCREPVTSGRETSVDHPITAAGEEIDCLALYDHVEISRDYVFSYRNRGIATIYTTLGRFAFWKIICRLSHRAELFAATAQMVVNALGTDHVPAVRAMVADVIHYAKLIRACVLASMEQAAPTPSGVLIPEASLVTAGRLYAIEQYPKIMQVLRDLSGQGLISRVPESTWMRSDVGAMLDEFLPGHDVSARDKNRLFNLVWDLTCSGHGLRTALFEALNATPAPALREDLYRIHHNPEARAVIGELAGFA